MVTKCATVRTSIYIYFFAITFVRILLLLRFIHSYVSFCNRWLSGKLVGSSLACQFKSVIWERFFLLHGQLIYEYKHANVCVYVFSILFLFNALTYLYVFSKPVLYVLHIVLSFVVDHYLWRGQNIWPLKIILPLICYNNYKT